MFGCLDSAVRWGLCVRKCAFFWRTLGCSTRLLSYLLCAAARAFSFVLPLLSLPSDCSQPRLLPVTLNILRSQQN